MRRRKFLHLAAVNAVASTALSRLSPAVARDLEPIAIQFTRFSAFYTPLIVLIGGGYLEQEGLKPHYSVAPLGKSALTSLDDGTAQVVQSAPGTTFSMLEKGEHLSSLHFAQINGRDGFFLVAQAPDTDFQWTKLRGKRLLISFDTQPITMFRYACFKQGVDAHDIEMIQGGSDDQMMAAFSRGEADYLHLQGPGPQDMTKHGIGAIVAALGQVTGPCAFSTLAAKPTWLASDTAVRFARLQKSLSLDFGRCRRRHRGCRSTLFRRGRSRHADPHRG